MGVVSICRQHGSHAKAAIREVECHFPGCKFYHCFSICGLFGFFSLITNPALYSLSVVCPLRHSAEGWGSKHLE